MTNPDTLPLWVIVFGAPMLYTAWFMAATKERRMRNNVIRNRRQHG